MEEKSGEAYSKKALYLSLGHFVTDLYPGFLPALLPLLIEKFHFSFTRASLLAMFMGFSTSLTQPVFGYLSDKLGGRWLIIIGPAVGGLCLSLVGLANSYVFLIFLLILGGLGVASYHPEAAALSASLSGRQRTLGMSLFMLGGNLGVGVGPFLILGITLSLGLELELPVLSSGTRNGLDSVQIRPPVPREPTPGLCSEVNAGGITRKEPLIT